MTTLTAAIQTRFGRDRLRAPEERIDEEARREFRRLLTIALACGLGALSAAAIVAVTVLQAAGAL